MEKWNSHWKSTLLWLLKERRNTAPSFFCCKTVCKCWNSSSRHCISMHFLCLNHSNLFFCLLWFADFLPLACCAQTLVLAGKNSEEEKGRQVTNWLSTTMLGKPGHLAWMKVVGSSGIEIGMRHIVSVDIGTWMHHGALAEAVNINGDLNSKMVKGIAGSELPAAAKDWQRNVKQCETM